MSSVPVSVRERIHSQENLGQLPKPSNEYDLHDACLSMSTDNFVSRRCIDISRFQPGQIKNWVHNVLKSFKSLEIFSSGRKSFADGKAAEFLEGSPSHNPSKFKLINCPVHLGDIMSTLAASRDLEEVHLQFSGGTMDEKLMCLLPTIFPNLEELTYLNLNPQILRIDRTVKNCVEIGQKLRRLVFHSTLSQLIKMSLTNQVRTLHLTCALHNEFTIDFPNLISFKFNGPIKQQQLTKAARSLVPLTRLRNVNIYQYESRSHPHPELGRQLANLLSSNRNINSFSVRIIYRRMKIAEKCIVDLCPLSSLSNLSWETRNFPTRFILPPGVEWIKLQKDNDEDDCPGPEFFTFCIPRASQKQSLKFCARSSSFSAVSHCGSSPALFIDLHSSGLLKQMCSSIVPFFPNFSEVTFNIDSSSLPAFHLILKFLLAETSFSRLSINEKRLRGISHSIFSLLAPLSNYAGKALVIKLSLVVSRHSPSVDAPLMSRKDRQFIIELADQTAISEFECSTQHGQYKLDPSKDTISYTATSRGFSSRRIQEDSQDSNYFTRPLITLQDIVIKL